VKNSGFLAITPARKSVRLSGLTGWSVRPESLTYVRLFLAEVIFLNSGSAWLNPTFCANDCRTPTLL
jgi:hypothetical protein